MSKTIVSCVQTDSPLELGKSMLVQQSNGVLRVTDPVTFISEDGNLFETDYAIYVFEEDDEF